MNNRMCTYAVGFHGGQSEWHHPISWDSNVGLYLCQAHHSIIQGRKFPYPGEMLLNKTLDQMRLELKIIEGWAVLKSGYKLTDIDKH